MGTVAACWRGMSEDLPVGCGLRPGAAGEHSMRHGCPQARRANATAAHARGTGVSGCTHLRCAVNDHDDETVPIAADFGAPVGTALRRPGMVIAPSRLEIGIPVRHRALRLDLYGRGTLTTCRRLTNMPISNRNARTDPDRQPTVPRPWRDITPPYQPRTHGNPRKGPLHPAARRAALTGWITALHGRPPNSRNRVISGRRTTRDTG